MQRHRIACGGARTFQGKERDIIFLSMVSAPNDVGGTMSGMKYDQRFNVAASRARDRMYLVRSVELNHLSKANRLRRSLIEHFVTPFAQDEIRVEDQRKLCESPFEREMYDELTQRGYWVTPQVRVGQYRIDMVVEGHNDARLAIECDGDKYHGVDKWADDMQRQRVLERAGWVFWRCFASTFIRRRKDLLDDLVKSLTERGIEPIGSEDAPRSVHTEHRVVSTLDESSDGQHAVMPIEVIEKAPIHVSEEPPARTNSTTNDDSSVETQLRPSTGNGQLISVASLIGSSVDARDDYPPFSNYEEYAGPPESDPRSVNTHIVLEGIIRIIEVEGPMVAKRAYDIYLRGCGIKRMGPDLKSTMNKALADAIQQQRLVSENEATERDLMYSVVRVKGSPPIKLRTRGRRSLEEIPPSELQVVARHLLERHRFQPGSDEHLRAILDFFDLKRLTTQAGTMLLEVLERNFPYVKEYLSVLGHCVLEPLVVSEDLLKELSDEQ